MRLIYLLFIPLFFSTCSASPSTDQAPESRDTATAPPSLLTSYTDTLPYPIVASFDELEPIFQYQNDTTYVINFWATWCGPCVEELPYFEQLAAATKGQAVKIILVSLDFKKDVRTKLLRFVRERPLELPVIALTDTKTNEWIDRVDPDWGGAIPITIIYKGSERVFIPDQFADYEELAQAVQTISQS